MLYHRINSPIFFLLSSVCAKMATMKSVLVVMFYLAWSAHGLAIEELKEEEDHYIPGPFHVL